MANAVIIIHIEDDDLMKGLFRTRDDWGVLGHGEWTAWHYTYQMATYIAIKTPALIEVITLNQGLSLFAEFGRFLFIDARN